MRQQFRVLHNTILSFFVFICLVLPCTGQDTFSICAVDPATGEVGSAGASCIGGSIIISDVHPGIGVIHTQSFYLSANQNYANGLMDQRLSPQQIMDSLVANDAGNDASVRQYGAVDLLFGTPRSAAFTGTNCFNYKNHITGSTYAIQGNILLGQQVLDSMEARFLRTPGPLACRLMEAMQGANIPGADTRCLNGGTSSLSAFIRVAKPGNTTGNFYLDLNIQNVPSGVEPIDSLQSLFDRWGGCVTDVAEFEKKYKAKVYPIPAREIVQIELPRKFVEAQLVIYNGKGILVQKRIVRSSSLLTIEKGDLNSGFYYFRIDADGIPYSGMFQFE